MAAAIFFLQAQDPLAGFVTASVAADVTHLRLSSAAALPTGITWLAMLMPVDAASMKAALSASPYVANLSWVSTTGEVRAAGA